MTIEVERIRAMLFDVDGTLSDTDDQWVGRFANMLRPFRFLFRDGNAHPFARWTMMAIETPGNLVYYWLDRLHLDDEVTALFNFMARRGIGRKSHPFWLIPGVDVALDQLGSHYPMAVVSARGRESTLSFLRQFNLLDHFGAVATSQTCRYTKPFPDPLVWAAEQLGVQPHECLMIGDTTVDMRAGKAAGAQTVGVLCGFGSEGELRRAGADLVIPSTADLPAALGW
jgi:N-acetyl-D-muramate 6-phosphate phosphatase